MKRLFKSVALALIVMAASCAAKTQEIYFNPGNTDIVLPNASAGSTNVFFNTNVQTVQAAVLDGSEWLDVKVYDGGVMSIIYSANDSEVERIGRIALTASDMGAEYKVTQPGKTKEPDPVDEPDDPEDEPLTDPDGPRTQFDGRIVVGYLPSGTGSGFQVRWDRVDVINLSFARINADGTLYDKDVRSSFANFAETAHEHGVKVVVSLGGASMLAEFDKAIVSAEARKNTVDGCVKLIKDLNLDGIDIDYESWGWNKDSGNPARAEGFLALAKGLRAAMGNSLMLTAALMGNTMENGWYTKEMFDLFDYITLMAYDRTSGKVGPHSAYEYFTSFSEIAVRTGMPSERVIPGVPFYGYKFKDGKPDSHSTMSYSQIVKTYKGSENQDSVESEYLFYDGKPMITKKCEYVVSNNLGGIMIWQIAQDATDADKSLLDVMHGILK